MVSLYSGWQPIFVEYQHFQNGQSCLLPLLFLLQLTKAVLCAPDKWLKRDRLGIMRAPYEIVVTFFDVE